MHYLKCNNCGHLNEVKSEYLVFCSKCNKKLENNFTDWKKRNTDRTFEDFKRLICIQDEDIQKNTVQKKPKTKKLAYWIGFTVMFAIFYAIGQFGGESIVKFFKSEKTSEKVLDQKWIRETYGDFGLTVETPFKMTKGDIQIPDNVKEVIEKMDVYEYTSKKGFKVMINSIKYSPIIGVANLKGAADGSVNEMKIQKGVADFNYTEDSISKNDIPGFIQKGTFKQNGFEVEFINTGFSKDLILWQVLTLYQADDEIGRLAAKKVIESIEINEVKSI